MEKQINWRRELFGNRLNNHGTMVDTVEALGPKEHLLIYFSAHWCPPCKAFTPSLAERYRKELVKTLKLFLYLMTEMNRLSMNITKVCHGWLCLIKKVH